MKTRQRINELRRAGTWTTRLKIAGDHYPGTSFDAMIEYMAWHLAELRQLRKEGKAKELPRPSEDYIGKKFDFAGYHGDTLQQFGESVVDAIVRRDAELFHELGDAISAWKRHKAKPDKLRLAILDFWLKREDLPKTKTEEYPPQKPSITMRDLTAHLVKIGLAEKALRPDEHVDLKRSIRRICKELEIKLGGKAGRPAK